MKGIRIGEDGDASLEDIVIPGSQENEYELTPDTNKAKPSNKKVNIFLFHFLGVVCSFYIYFLPVMSYLSWKED